MDTCYVRSRRATMRNCAHPATLRMRTRARAKKSCLHDGRRLVVPGPPSPLRPPPLWPSTVLPSPLRLIGRRLVVPGSLPASLPPCPGRQRQTAPAAADCSAARDCQGNHNHKERCGVLRRCKRKGPLTPGTATAAPGAAMQSPEKTGAAAASAYASCHSTEYYRLPQQCTLMAAFMCYACYALDMTWSCNIIRRVLGTLS